MHLKHIAALVIKSWEMESCAELVAHNGMGNPKVNFTFLPTIFKKGAGNGISGVQRNVTFNQQLTHYTSNFF
jgi:hypothetical protein